MDFDWPLGQVWGGYVMPNQLREADCPDCNGGWTDAAGWVSAVAYVISGLADDADDEARGKAMHPWLTPLREISYNSAKGRPGPGFAEFADGLAKNVRPNSIFGREVYATRRALIAAAGLPEDWGHCPTCKGHASLERYEGQRAEAEAWEWTQPPTGEGWQMWETTSEGSPTSPVFATPEELAEWCADGTTVFGRNKIPADKWLAIIKGDDFAHVQIAPGVVLM